MQSKWFFPVGQGGLGVVWLVVAIATGQQLFLIPAVIHWLLAMWLLYGLGFDSPSPATSVDRQEVQRGDGRTPDGRSQGSGR